ncbi:MAG: ABC transporter permease subunit [Acidimicrobiia bacterium]
MSLGTVVTTELDKQFRRTRTFTAIGLVSLIPIIMTIALKASPPEPGADGILLQLASQSGLFVPAAALRFTSEFMLVIVAAIFGGEAIAGEAQWGNLRYLLMRPIARGRLFSGKLIVATVSILVAVAMVVIVGLVVGGLAFGLDPISFPFTFFASLTTGDVIVRLAFAVLFVSWMLMSVVTFSLMVGCMTDSTGGAVFAGVGLWMTWLILDAIESLGRIRYFFPTHYSGDWVWTFTRDSFSPDLWRGALLTLGYVVVFTAFAAWWFRRKDILS